MGKKVWLCSRAGCSVSAKGATVSRLELIPYYSPEPLLLIPTTLSSQSNTLALSPDLILSFLTH